MDAHVVDIETCEMRCEMHAAARLLVKTKQRNGVRLILYLVAGGFAFSGAVVLIKPLVPEGDYDLAFKADLYDWIDVARYEMLRKIMYYSVGCSSFMLWCMMFMNRLSLARQIRGHRRLALDFLASLIDLAVWVSLLRLVLVCSREKQLRTGICDFGDANSQALCEILLGELWFRQKMGVICAQMVGLVHFILFVGIFPDTLFEVVAAIRGRSQDLPQPTAWEDQKLYGQTAYPSDVKSAQPSLTPPPPPYLPSPQHFTIVEQDDEEIDKF